jgi:hypothetical protein
MILIVKYSGEKSATLANYDLLILFACTRNNPIERIFITSVINVDIVLSWSRSKQLTQNLDEAAVLVMDRESHMHNSTLM